MKIVVLDAGTLGFPASIWADLEKLGELCVYDATVSDSREILLRVSDADVVFTNKVPLSAKEIEASPSLRYIGVLATGYNIIDIEAANRAGVTVCNVPAYSTASTSQHAIALILELCNRVGVHSTSVHSGEWLESPHFSYWKSAPLELEAMTVGVVGFGTIGRRVAETLSAMGAKIIASARRPRNPPPYKGFEWANNEEIFRRADLVTLHCPETPENSGFVNAELLGLMRPGALLVNTARGGLVDELALASALRSGQLAGAALDVVRAEPMLEDCPLLGLENCIITPHIAWASEPARLRLVNASVEQLKLFLAGKPINIVAG